MRRSSTSSSDRRAPGRSPGRRWALWAGSTALVLLAIEGLLRIPEVRAQLPTRTHYYDTRIVERLEALERTKRTHGRIDVLFVGSSIVRTNIQPLVFDRIVRTRTNTPLVSFNAGLSALWPPAVRLYLERLWLPAAQPRLVVQGIRYPELAATTHAMRESQVFSGTVEAAWSETTWPKQVYSAAAERIHLLQYRGTFVRLLQRYVHGRPGRTTESAGADAMDARGYTPRTVSRRDSGARRATQTLPHPEHSCQAAACQVGFAALRQAIHAARMAGADYVLVNIPEHGTQWRRPGGRERYRAYLSALAAFAADEGVQFLDPTDGDPYSFDSDDEYSDTYHMTPAGAERLTAVLAHRLGRAAASRLSRPTLHEQRSASDGRSGSAAGPMERPPAR